MIRPARESGELIVTEGYMDVIALSQAGFGQAVAYASAPTLYSAPPTMTSTAGATPTVGKSCGTAITPTQPTAR